MKSKYFGLTVVLVVSFMAVFVSFNQAYGAGYALIEQGVSGLGNAYAGGAASALDATTIFYNPAGLTRFNSPQIVAGGHLIIPSAKFTNEGSTHVLQSRTGVPLRGDNGDDAGVTAFVPNLYYSMPIGQKLSFGIGINSPFGLETDYGNTWVGRYHAIKSAMMTININPTIAYKVTDQLSLGAGVSIQYIKAELTNAIDFGTMDALGVFAPIKIGLMPQMADGFVKLKGDSWGLGFNIGALYEFNKDTRVGIQYRSKIKQKLKGDAEFSGVPSALGPLPVFKNGGISAEVTLPDSASASFYHDINQQWAVMADVTWMGWRTFDELRIKFDNPAQADAVTTTKWTNAMRYSAGLSYKPIDRLTLRTGVAYDETPISEAKYRTPRIPDTNRTWIAFGAGYKFSDKINLDCGYVHIFFGNSETDKLPVGEDAVRGGLKGSYKGHVNILSLQLTYMF
ncbi:MAG: outer membrane protein transport protein [Thermodesulfovibrionales bacterium]|nr:outer membrane protein transport protein [Thermodesulfovibrionales bacterium]